MPSVSPLIEPNRRHCLIKSLATHGDDNHSPLSASTSQQPSCRPKDQDQDSLEVANEVEYCIEFLRRHIDIMRGVLRENARSDESLRVELEPPRSNHI